ncbi:hypothetical protein SAMD00023353_0204060 [Rosellinia necatrix]|uniref:Uncharacterized protein n=1 Tax=Rosellinia necatrix TaxID=77044 RepID=A0A1W2TP18_ROSNE|nr:hypothetical protein SAMD00023353_0204060 [Rosellinia necatrix]
MAQPEIHESSGKTRDMGISTFQRLTVSLGVLDFGKDGKHNKPCAYLGSVPMGNSGRDLNRVDIKLTLCARHIIDATEYNQQPETRKHPSVQSPPSSTPLTSLPSNMKVYSALALFAGLSTAASILAGREVSRPYSILASVSVPDDAPADYHATTASLTTEVRSASVQRRESLKKARGPITANDFYECATTQGTPPRASDCTVVINNVLASNQALVIAPGACLLFQYSTCWGFFCSLCERLGTDTNFIASQLTTAQTLCVSGGSAGTIVGEDAPQWEAGFIRANGQLPNYAGDVC